MMYMNAHRALTAYLLIFTAAACAACGKKKNAVQEVDYTVKGDRDNTPIVLTPEAEGDLTLGNEEVEIDASHLDSGYIGVRYTGNSSKVKLQITPESDITYTYDLKLDDIIDFFPFSDGDGHYRVGVYTNVKDTMYAVAYTTEFDIALSDPFAPFLYPNQYVWFTEDMETIDTARMVVNPANTDLEAITNVYNYVISHVEYDWDEAETVQSGYLPDVDEVLDTGRGICFDYAALMAAMLRSQGIPARLEIGYAGTAYHAWLSAYTEDTGWINGIIRFDGTDWSLMDPTFASNQDSRELEKFIGDGDNYRSVYMY